MWVCLARLFYRWGDFFVGLGAADARVPAVLRADGRIFNRCGYDVP
jgi:hypothetical protein